MPTTVTKTIGSTGDYTSLQAWEDAAPANLVTADQIWRGECLKETFSSSTMLLTISGSTSDATRYKELTTATCASFRDDANAQTNALAYNASLGAAIDLTGNYTTAVVASENYCRVSNLMIRGAAVDTSIPISSGLLATIENCILDNRSTGGSSTGTSCSVVGPMNNVVSIRRKATVPHFIAPSGSLNTTWKNCTVVTLSDFGVSTQAIRAPYGTLNLINVAVFNCSDPASGGATINKTNCYTDATASGWTTVAFDTSTGSGFQGISAATVDLRIKSTSALKDNGSASGAATDIVGTARPQGSAYDVGAWEYKTAAASAASALIRSALINSSTIRGRLVLC